MRIYLIGFMGSGKTFAGRRLAQQLQLPFVDLDTCIEQEAGQAVTDIFAAWGEPVFRELERRALHATLCHTAAVIATGGGAPCFFDNMTWMNQHGLTLFLDIPPATLLRRLRREREQRPLLRGRNEQELEAYIRKTLQQRRPFYERAHVVFTPPETDTDTAERLCRQFIHITGH